MNILFISAMSPFSCSGGGEQRTHLLYKALSEIGDVYLIGCASENKRISDRHFELAATTRAGIKGIINSLWYRFLNLIYPDRSIDYLPFPMKWDIGDCFPGVKFDLVVHRGTHFIGLYHAWNIAPMVVDVDDEPVQAYDTIHKNSVSPLRRWLVRKIIRFMLKRILCHAEAFWLSNPNQKDSLRMGRPADILLNLPIVASGVSDDALKDANGDGYIFTVGALSHPPNYLGLDKFLSEVWPEVRRRYPSLAYKIAGKGLPGAYKAKWAKLDGIELLGFVEDMAALYKRALAAVVPIYSGSGTCIKVLESMAYSRVCISTEFGARGIDYDDISNKRTNILIYQDRESFIQALASIKEDEVFRKTQERLGREYYLRHFSYENFVNQVKSVVIRATKRG